MLSFMEPIQSELEAGSGWKNLSDRFAKTGDADRFLRLLHLIQQREASGLKFRNSNLSS